MTSPLASMVGVHQGDMVAFVGGGGKTRLMIALGRELAGAGLRIVMTTTTRMGVDEIPAWATICHTPAELMLQLAAGRPAFLIGAAGAEKIAGIDPALANEIHAAASATVLVEADGAKHRPFKAPESHEPVIPASTTLVVLVAGLDAIGGMIADVCHRPERVAGLAGRDIRDPLRAVDMATVLSSPDGGMKGVPAAARVTIALTLATPGHTGAIESIRSAVRARVAVLPDDL